MELFIAYRTGLCLAVVPAWLTVQRWSVLSHYAEKGGALFCWHLHGYRHKNHEPRGRKQEFGPSRPAVEIRSELAKGFDRLKLIMGDHAFPVFTPPWNRCSMDSLTEAARLGFKAVS